MSHQVDEKTHLSIVCQIDEDEEWSKAAVIDLQNLFVDRVVSQYIFLYFNRRKARVPCCPSFFYTNSLLIILLQQIVSVEELSLTANQKKSDMKSKYWQVENDDEAEADMNIRSQNFLRDGYQIELQPMEIRTFSVFLSK